MYVLSSTLAHLLRKIIASDASRELRTSTASLVTVRRRGVGEREEEQGLGQPSHTALPPTR